MGYHDRRTSAYLSNGGGFVLLSSEKALFTYPPGAIAWSPDGKYIALIANTFRDGGAPHKVQILEVATEKLVSSYLMPASASSADSYALVWSPDGKYLASGNGQVWFASSWTGWANWTSRPSMPVMAREAGWLMLPKSCWACCCMAMPQEWGLVCLAFNLKRFHSLSFP